MEIKIEIAGCMFLVCDSIDCSIGVHTGAGRKLPYSTVANPFPKLIPHQRAFGLPVSQNSWLYVASAKKSGRCKVNVGIMSCCCHGAGTHTECIGHILPSIENVNDPSIADGHVITIEECGVPLPPFVPTILLSVMLVTLLECGEKYNDITEIQKEQYQDLVISKQELVRATEKLEEKFEGFHGAVCIRVLPNDTSKYMKNWTGTNPPYLTQDACEWITDTCAFQHVLVDLPSVDREDDGGRLVAHKNLLRAYDAKPTPHTITELCYFPSRASDGYYFLNLQIPSIDMDAAPSRPVLYSIKNLSKDNVNQ